MYMFVKYPINHYGPPSEDEQRRFAIPRLAQALSALAQAWAILRSAYGEKCIVRSFIETKIPCASWDNSQEAYDKIVSTLQLWDSFSYLRESAESAGEIPFLSRKLPHDTWGILWP
jgi:hypothetical protein